MAEMNFKFLSELSDELKCCICLEVAKNPKQEEGCGKLFCSGCIEKWKGTSCPSCRANEPRYFTDKKSLREIRALGVRCSNVEDGCEWEGTFATLQDHLIDCDFVLVSCPNGCMGSNKGILELLKKDLEEHTSSVCPERSYKCQDCGLVDKYRVISGAHQDECDMKKISCMNKGCSIVLERCQIQEHMQQSCIYSEVACKYASIGCKEKQVRKKIEAHEEDTEYHMSLALNMITELHKRLSNIESQPQLSKAVTEVTIMMSNYAYKKRMNKGYYSQPFFTSPLGYKVCLQFCCNGFGIGKESYLSLFVKILHGPYDDQLEWPMKATFTIELLNQLEDKKHVQRILEFNGEGKHCVAGGTSWGYHRFVQNSKLDFDQVMNTQYLMNDKVYIRVTSKTASALKPWLKHTHTS